MDIDKCDMGPAFSSTRQCEDNCEGRSREDEAATVVGSTCRGNASEADSSGGSSWCLRAQGR